MKKRIPEIVGGLLTLLFAYTAFSKLFAFQQFESVLSSAPVIGNYAGLLAVLIPAVELIIIRLLLVIKTRRAGLLASASLLIVFSLYLVYMVLTASDLPCSCGGVIQQLGWKEHIVFNILFIGATAVGIAQGRKNKIREAF